MIEIMNNADPRGFFDNLNHEYLAVHRRKEDLFWATYMGTSGDHDGFAAAETAWKAFISDPARLAAVRGQMAEVERMRAAARPRPASTAREREELDELAAGLRGWEALFANNVVEGAEGRRWMERLVAMESELFRKRQALVLRHRGERGEEEASLGVLLVNIGANPDEACRQSSFDALRGLERWVLANGFLEVVKARNAFARAQGSSDYFDYKVRKSEAMTPEELFTILDDFEARTRDANARGFAALERAHGPRALLPWNYRFHMSGDVVREMDPYFAYADGLARWALSFRRMGVSFRGAEMQLDLLERKGKYQNGFCHGPVPAFRDRGAWVPAKINFTSAGKPDQVGSGYRALETLFHEGGHAAHFANIQGNAPCFSQEFPPTSMAYAETQSMFFESVLEDADWLMRYARDAAGEPMPLGLIRKRIEIAQPFRAFNERSILVVPCFERALYALPEAELTAERVLQLARETERRIFGTESHRPLLAIPHLLNQESAASYHGYLLANMAVYQTRAWFLETQGYIADNPRVGPLLDSHYWAPGNSMTHDETLRSLTGESFSAKYLAAECNRSPEEAWAEAERAMSAAARRGEPQGALPRLDAFIRVVDGDSVIADNSLSDDAMCATFSAAIGARWPRGTGT
jgi:oligoendopeptidase F